jgi:hypothetical protein
MAARGIACCSKCGTGLQASAQGSHSAMTLPPWRAISRFQLATNSDSSRSCQCDDGETVRRRVIRVLLALHVRSNLPKRTPRVLHHRPPVAVRLICGKLKCFCARCDCSPISLIDTLHVDVKKSRRRLPKAIPVANHNERIADPNLRRAVGVELTLPSKNLVNETNHLFRLRRDNPRNHRVPVVWPKMFHRRRLSIALRTLFAGRYPFSSFALSRLSV